MLSLLHKYLKEDLWQTLTITLTPTGQAPPGDTIYDIMQASEIWFVKNRLWFSKGGIKSRSNHASSVIVFEPFCSGIKKVRQINTLGRELINGKEEKLIDIPGDRMQFVVKAYEMGLKDFSPAEIERVFAGCVAPKMCETALRGLIFNGLTMENIRAVGQPLLIGDKNV